MICRQTLDGLYRRYNRREFVHPDPLEFLYAYPAVYDREIVGLIASGLAYGRVAQILKSVRIVLGKMGGSPRGFVESTPEGAMNKVFAGFKHRFTTGEEMASMLSGARRIVRKYGGLGECFACGLSKSDETVMPALERFTSELNCNGKYLIPSPGRGSACKRLHLYLRWMVRKDDVDPGGWDGIPAAKLLVPLDTHMASIGKGFGFTKRNAADITMAHEITDAFRNLCREDPVKYDFCLTRFGIRAEMDKKDLFKEVKA